MNLSCSPVTIIDTLCVACVELYYLTYHALQLHPIFRSRPNSLNSTHFCQFSGYTMYTSDQSRITVSTTPCVFTTQSINLMRTQQRLRHQWQAKDSSAIFALLPHPWAAWSQVSCTHQIYLHPTTLHERNSAVECQDCTCACMQRQTPR